MRCTQDDYNAGLEQPSIGRRGYDWARFEHEDRNVLRACARCRARRRIPSCGITGWVSNLADGSVEALVQGPAEQIDRMLEWMRRGPPSARVTDFVSEERALEKRFARFEQH